MGDLVASSASKLMWARAWSWESSPVRKTAGRAEERCREASWAPEGKRQCFVMMHFVWRLWFLMVAHLNGGSWRAQRREGGECGVQV